MSELPAEQFVAIRGSLHDDDVLQRPSISYWQDAWIRLRANKVAIGSAGYIVSLIIVALIVPELIPYRYDEQEVWNKHRAPTLGEEAQVVANELPIHKPLQRSLLPAAGENTPDAMDAGEFDPPPAPKGVELVGQALTTGVTLRWLPVPAAEGYRIYRSIASDTLGVPLEDVNEQHISYQDRSSLAIGQTYYYFVTAFNAFDESQSPTPLEVSPDLALRLGDARKIDPQAQVGQRIRTRAHYLGTDYLGRDMLARVLVGARISLFIGIFAPLLYVLIGIAYGSISGYFGGLVDDVMMRITDIVVTVPELLVVILLQVAFGSSITTLLIALVVVAWGRSARQIRGEVLRLREMEFVHAGKVLGTPFPKMVSRHLLPNVMGTVLVFLTLAVPQAIFAEAFLSFIGLGIAPPLASWGTITKEGAKVFLTYPHELLIPSALICTTMLAFNLFGDGLRDALDPKLRGTQ